MWKTIKRKKRTFSILESAYNCHKKSYHKITWAALIPLRSWLTIFLILVPRTLNTATGDQQHAWRVDEQRQSKQHRRNDNFDIDNRNTITANARTELSIHKSSCNYHVKYETCRTGKLTTAECPPYFSKLIHSPYTHTVKYSPYSTVYTYNAFLYIVWNARS